MFKISGEQWYIKFVPTYDTYLRRSDGSTSVGACDDNTKTIYLANTLRGSFLKKVLCHEVTHAAMFSYNIDLTLDQEELLANLIASYGEEIIDIADELFRKLGETK